MMCTNKSRNKTSRNSKHTQPKALLHSLHTYKYVHILPLNTAISAGCTDKQREINLRKRATQKQHYTQMQIIPLGTAILEKCGRKNCAPVTKKLFAYAGNVQLPKVCVT